MTSNTNPNANANIKSNASKLKPTRQFLSGEADSALLAKRQTKLSSMLGDMSVSRRKDADSGGAESEHENKSIRHDNVRRPLIEEIDEVPTPKGADAHVVRVEKAADALHCGSESSDDEMDEESSPPPLSAAVEATYDDNSDDETDEESFPPPLSAAVEATNDDNGSYTSKSSQLHVGNERNATTDRVSDPPALMETMIAEAMKAKRETEKKAIEKERKCSKKSSFGSGLKKGFLSQSSKNRPKSKKSGFQKGFLQSPKPKATLKKEVDSFNTAKSKASTKPIPTTKSTPTPSPSIMDDMTNEVHEGMKRNNPLEHQIRSGEWITPDLMTKISQNPRLMAGMSNPKFTAALEALQKNPSEAMKKFQHHPEVIDFLKEFCGVMGHHFTKLDDVGSKKGKQQTEIGPLARSALNKHLETKNDAIQPGMTRDERERLDKIMADEELTKILMDPEFQRVMQECQHHGRMQMYMRDEKYGPKLRRLIEAGLLQVVR